MRKWIFVLLLFHIVIIHVDAQALCLDFKEDLLKGRVKQIDEFMSRFNMDETWDGKKITDKSDLDYRKKYIKTLFDHDKYRNADGTFSPVVERFVNDVADNGYEIHYEDSTWNAEVKCNASICDKKLSVTLYLQTQQQRKDEYVWIIKDVKGNLFASQYDNSSKGKPHLFISPMEHEIGFVGILDKPYKGADLRRMVADDYSSNRITMLAMLLESGLLNLKTIEHVSFHFSSVPGWVFIVNRKEKQGSYNTGWLITEIKEMTDSKRK